MIKDEDRAKAWVKNKTNQSRVISECVGAKPNVNKVAIFMAGIPGAVRPS